MPEWRILALICLAATMAAAVTAAVAVPRRAPTTSDPSIVALEPGGSAAHHSGRRDAVADARRRAACRGVSYRLLHAATCPSLPRGARGARAFEAVSTGTGSWGSPFQVASWPIHEIVLPTGKVLWLTPGDGPQQGGRAFVWNPATNATREVDPPNVRYADGSVKSANLFCAGHSQLGDGRILVAGGNLAYPDSSGGPDSDFKGAPWIFTFDPWSETWTRQTDMPHGRWYPTLTTLPDGSALIIGGTDETGDNINNTAVELFRPAAKIDGQGTVQVVSRRAVSLYPHLFVVPDGTAAGSRPGTQVLLAGQNMQDTAILNTADWSWTDVPDLPTPRLWGSAVLMPSSTGTPSTVMMVGGSNLNVTPSAQRATVTLDLNDVAAGWKAGPALAAGRSHLNAVILPDDSILAIGGGGGIGNGSLYVDPVYAAERLTPGAAGWSAAGAQAEERTYHSTAVLLPDGRVLSAGDDRSTHSDPSQRRGELYSPPYLASGVRPSIDSAPAAVRYGAPFGVVAGGSGPIDHAVLIRPAAVTHANDMDQRSIRLGMSGTSGGITLTSPSDPSVAPPGYYMLFLVDAQGRPSVARWIRLDPAAGDAPQIAPVVVAGGAPVAPPVKPGAKARRRPAALKVREVRLRGRMLRITLTVKVAARRGAQLSVVPPARRKGAKRPPALVRRIQKGKARTGSVVVSVITPRGWTGLSLPVIVRITGGAKTVRTREKIVVKRARPRPIARVVR